MKILKKSLILLLCLSTLCATGLPLQLSKGVFIMKIIYINSPKYGVKECLVDDEDYDFLNQWKWSIANWDGFYVCRHEGKEHRELIRMHRLIMKANCKEIIDHKDGNSLNNQKCNLRMVTALQNSQNRKAMGESKYKGVSIVKYKIAGKEYKYYLVRITHNKKRIRLGRFNFTPENEILAAKLFDEAAKKYHGEFVRLNFK